MKIKLLVLIGLFGFVNISFANQSISVEEYNQRQIDFAKKKQVIISNYKANKEKQIYNEKLQQYNAKLQQYNASKQEKDKVEAMSEQEKSLYILGKNNSASVK